MELDWRTASPAEKRAIGAYCDTTRDWDILRTTFLRRVDGVVRAVQDDGPRTTLLAPARVRVVRGARR